MATFNFTENAKMALAYAQEEAINMKHRMIGTEHVSWRDRLQCAEKSARRS